MAWLFENVIKNNKIKKKRSGMPPLDFPSICLLTGIVTSLRQQILQFINKIKEIYKIIQYFLRKEL